MLSTVALTIAQRTVTGTVTGDDGSPLIGATVLVKGTTVGTVTDIDGNYSVRIPAGSTTLVFSYTGYQTGEAELGASNVLDITLRSGEILDEVVVTALGVTRYKNELPYSAQKVDGDDIAGSRNANMVNTLSGRVAGLNIRKNNSFGGSTNIVLRGSKSLTGDNQAMFVIDGVPVDNSNTNTSLQRQGREGFDYGNAANDINSDDIESVTVLKGAAASALYGSRAANGVVMITTKKGRKDKGLGVSLNTGVNFGKIDKSTFIKYQQRYGGGYGNYYEDPSGYFLYRDINGDGVEDLVMPVSEDASYGGKFDPSLLVYQWDAFDPSSPNFGKPTPWIAAKNQADAFFETSVGTSNSIFIDGSNDKGYFKLGYTYNYDDGVLPASNITKNMVNFGAGYNLTDRLNVFSSINFTSTDGLGRYGTGYGARNPMTMFRQWWQVNIDVLDQKRAYEDTKQNVTWNWADPDDLVPIYWNNPYWERFENYENDHRNRYLGYLGATYSVNDWFSITGRASLDQYAELQETRIAVGSVDPAEYARFNRNFQELNYDLMGQISQLRIADNLKFNALLGTNIRKTAISSINAVTNGGLILPRLYSLSNTKNPLQAPVETQTELEVDGVFASAGFVYDNWAILDLSIRRDQASSLPAGNNIYYYPSASLGIIFSRFVAENDAFTFGKLRVNYAQVGNTAPPLSVNDVYVQGTGFGDAPIVNVPTTKNNANLKPEQTKSLEAGLEMRFLKDRLGFDFTWYKMNTIDQILPATISRATGYASKFINAGDVENKGVELQVFARLVNSPNFKWNIDLNWARNRNKVLDLGGIDNLQLGSFQGGVSINAALNEPYGTIRGSNFVYADGHEGDANYRMVNAAGRYLFSATSSEIIGNVNPDWTGGVYNTFTFFKSLSLGFLIDIRQGGDIWSLDRYYGMATGLPSDTDGKNDLGNDLRLPLDQGGGVVLNGVKADGSPNDIRADASVYGLFGYARTPAAGFVYDGSYIKLRELSLTYDFPKSMFAGADVIKGMSLGVYGRNLWIIHKNLPDADPEDGMSAGNLVGYQGGAYPSVRVFGVNLNVKF